MRDSVVPLLEKLGCDTLCRGTCQQSLIQLLGTIFSVPGFLGCLHSVLVGRLLTERSAVAAVGWFLLSVASQVNADT
jgi:hypothetical protein